MILGPWRSNLKPSECWKVTRARRLDREFVEFAKSKGCRFRSWTRYVSMAACSGAEYVDGSHFTNSGAEYIFDTMLRRELSYLINNKCIR